MRKLVAVLSVVLCVQGVFADVLTESGAKGGIVVRIGLDNPEELAGLRASKVFVVHGLDTDAAKVEQARRYLLSKKLNGPVAVAQFDGKKLPYINNLINLIIIDKPGVIPNSEIVRVLAPYGTAVVGGKKMTKPYPREMDEWPQYLHGADNNAVAKDSVVGPPRHMQWVTDPVWSRSHMSIPTVTSLVTSKGRLFSVEDQATAENPFLPGRFALVARDAFNGVKLWDVPFSKWESITRYIKDINVQLQKRVVADGDVVYFTPGIAAPVTLYDAATGKALKEYKGTGETQEFSLHNGVLYAVVGDRMNAGGSNYDRTKGFHASIALGGSDTSEKARFEGSGFPEGYTKEFIDKDKTVCRIIAVDTTTGKLLWKSADIVNYTGGSLALKGDYAVYLTVTEVKALNAKTGKAVWGVAPPAAGKSGKPSKKKGGSAGTMPDVLVISGQTVYASHGNGFSAYSLKTGDVRWSNPTRKNYRKTVDLFVVRGTAWSGGSGAPTSYDPEIGSPKVIHKQQMTGPMPHDRCYRNFITEKYYINSKTGGADFVDLRSGEEFPQHWVRGTCGMGTLPANGLLYAPPYSCQCSFGSQIKGFLALYTEPGLLKSGQPIKIDRKPRLVKGPAFSQVSGFKFQASSSDWPVFRKDNARSGSTDMAVPSRLAEKWQVKFTGIPSAPVVAAGKVFISDVDTHTVYALDAASGKAIWRYTADGRVDSPPTCHKGTVLFGSLDGWVYCLRASDGELVWRFKDLPDRLIGARNQLESAWPVHGSVLVKDGLAYFAAGRSTYLDGGITLYALDAKTGAVKHRRTVYGTFEDNGFPVATRTDSNQDSGFKGGLMLVGADSNIYLRHKGFTTDLVDLDTPVPHLIPSAGFLDPVPQHRTYWTYGTGYAITAVQGADTDIMVVDGDRTYGVNGFPTSRHSYFDPRKNGYKFFCASTKAAVAPAAKPVGKKKKKKKGGKKRGGGKAVQELWSTGIPLTGKAMLKAGDTIFVAGTPMKFDGNPFEKYEAAYNDRLGGVLWMASAKDGKKVGELKLDAAPAWDRMVAADGKLFMVLKDGTLRCMGK